MRDRPKDSAGHGRARPEVLHTLEAVQVLSDSMDRMHNTLKGPMEMNPSDVAALRMLVIRERQGQPVTPQDIACHLQISTASATVLVDRLVDAGHARRRPHPRDRRSRVVELTDLARRSFHHHFGARLAAMREVIDARDDEELRLIAEFLTALADSMVAPLPDPTTAPPQEDS
ncbi:MULTISPECIES: MarR family winged helix-turn-helix transcriptional regulator [Actinomycetes]|uniref:MarR family transcriptional regulator n=2 Tax=Actinomycetes TaxID=1760 RepID=A0ABP6LWY5_9MICC